MTRSGDERFDVAMRHATIGMAIIAPDGSFLEVNPALSTMLGRTEDELLASSWQELTHPEDLEIDVALVHEVLDGRRDSYRLAKRYLRPDGSVVFGDLSVGCVRDDSGAVEFFVSQIVDQTERDELAERYRLLAENVTDVIAAGDNNGVITWISPSVERVLGWPSKELIGRRFGELVHPEDRPRIAEVHRGLLEGRSAQVEARLLEASGDHHWMNIRIRPVVDEHGSITGRIAGLWDAEAEHEAGEALARSEARYGAALAAKRDPHVFLDAVRDEDGTIVDFAYADANAAALEWLGKSLEELQAQSLLTAFPGHRATGMFDQYVHTVETGEHLVADERHIHSEILGTDAWFDFRGVRVLDGLSLSWRDVTSKVRTRNELAEAEERHRLLAENASDVVLRATAEGVVDWAAGSTQELFGRSAAEMLGLRARDLFDPESLRDVPAARERINNGETDVGRVLVIRGDGSRRWLGRRNRAIFGADGEVRWYVTSLRDIALEVAGEEALRASEAQARDLAERYERARNEALEASRAKTVFLSRMSHELRTPLNAILGFAQLLDMDDLSVDQHDAVRQIRTGGRHLLDLISEVLDISRIESGRLSLSMESVAVADAVNEALDLVRALAEAAGVRVDRVDGGTCVAQVWADRQRMIQILLNLVSNAVKYNHRGGSVEISCESLPGDLLAIRVADTGPGLSPDQIGHIFEPFDRLGAERTDIEGTGIGLTLSEALARLMSGRLEVSSEPGLGSVFSLVLPKSTLPISDAADLAEPVLAVPDGSSRVLYIEDNPANIHLMERIAGVRAGVRLRIATNGAAGIEAVEEEVPDLVLLDLHLPDMRGEAVLAVIRELPGMRDIPVVVVTADASPGLAQRLTGLGAQAVLTKPIDVGEVLAWLDRPARGSEA